MAKIISKSINISGQGDNYVVEVIQKKDNGRDAVIREELSAEELVDSGNANMNALIQMEMQLKPLKKLIDYVDNHKGSEELVCLIKGVDSIKPLRDQVKDMAKRIGSIRADNKAINDSVIKAKRYLSDKKADNKNKEVV
jgi:hypothetical protein